MNIFLLFVTFLCLEAQQNTCAYCDQAIEHTYISFQGKTYHESCYKNFIQTRCAKCNKPINDKYIVYDGKKYHEECYKQFVQPRCEKCGLPLDGKYIVHENKKYHESCYKKNIAIRCALCGEIINGTYTTDYWGNKYHSSHDNTDARCDYCDRFISPHLTKGGSKYNDGRVICNICEASAVKSLTKAETIFNSVRNSIGRFGIKINHNRIDLKIVDRNTLKSVALAKGGLTDTRGFAEYSYWRSGNNVERKEFTVYILAGMPQKDFEAVAAHELMHVWQYLNSDDKMDAQLREGSAEYIAFLHMNKYSDDESKIVIHKITTNRDNTYGGGFRKVQQLVDEKGLDYFLNELRK